MRPSSIFFGRNGSAIDGRAQPMKSSTPWRIIRDHDVGAGEAADADDGLVAEVADTLDQRFLRRLLLEARRAGAILPGAVREIPEIRQVAVHLDELAHLGIGKAKLADRFVERDAQRESHRVADRVAHIGDHLAGKARTVFQAAAVFVRPLVGGAAQEVLEDAEAMRAVETDQIEAGDFAIASPRSRTSGAGSRYRSCPSPAPAPDRW